MIRSSLYLSIFLSFFPLHLLQAADLTFNENEQTVTDRFAEPINGTGSDVTVITREEIEQRHAAFVPDLLRMIPGVEVFQREGPLTDYIVVLRGTGFDRALLALDGVPLNNSDGSVDLIALTTTNLER